MNSVCTSEMGWTYTQVIDEEGLLDRFSLDASSSQSAGNRLMKKNAVYSHFILNLSTVHN